jgi:phenylalanyl-tRNA synthetase beta chain
MLISRGWLREYVATTQPAAQLAERIMLSSSESEGIIDWQSHLSGLVVGHVASVTKHPDSDHLNVAQVQLGSFSEEQIVCGAPNLRQGQKVIVAPVGTEIHPLHGDLLTIGERNIRGVVSRGMLCGADEIGLAIPGEDGLLILPDDAKPGTPLANLLGMDEPVLDLSITPNRPDLLSYLGIAREVAALERLRLQEPPIAILGDQNEASLEQIYASIADPELCMRYSAIIVESDELTKPSPLWMQARLLMANIRPLSLVVDIANYCMLEYGHPLHTFDADVLDGKSLEVRAAQAGESLTTLNGETYQLEPADIVIAVDGVADDLAGIMGGKHSSISSSTRRVLIESACFAGVPIRRTSRRLGIRTEASGRFEKGLDPEQTVAVLRRAVYLLQQLANAKVTSRLLDCYPRPERSRERITLSLARLQQLSGVAISGSEAKNILQSLGFQVAGTGKTSLEVTPPSWRHDVERPEDIVEEIIRIWGYDKLPSTLPSGSVRAPRATAGFDQLQRARITLAAAGYHELVSSPFIGGAQLERSGIQPVEAARLSKPLSDEAAYLIPSHLPAFLQAVAGPNRETAQMGLFEIGNLLNHQHHERRMLSILERQESGPEQVVRQLKYALAQAVAALGGDHSLLSYLPTSTSPAYFAPGAVVQAYYAGIELGYLGIVREAIIQAWKLRRGKCVGYCEIRADVVLEQEQTPGTYQPGQRFPVVPRAITLVVSEAVSVQRIITQVSAQNCDVGQRAIGDVTIYRGNPYGADEKAVTLQLIYQHPERTLTEAEVHIDLTKLQQLQILPSTTS